MSEQELNSSNTPNPSDDQNADIDRAAGPNDPSRWQMPRPVFQQTSGYLPQGFVKEIEKQASWEVQPAAPAESAVSPDDIADLGFFESSEDRRAGEQDALPVQTAPPNTPPSGPSASIADIAIEPQPDISDQFVYTEEVTPAPAPSAKGGSGKLMIFVVLVVFLLLLAAIVTAAVYFLILSEGTPASNNF